MLDEKLLRHGGNLIIQINKFIYLAWIQGMAKQIIKKDYDPLLIRESVCKGGGKSMFKIQNHPLHQHTATRCGMATIAL